MTAAPDAPCFPLAQAKENSQNGSEPTFLRLRPLLFHIHFEESTSPHSMRAKIYIGVLLVAIGTFHAATVRQGHLWADDFAMYVHHAQNIVGGRPYTDTGYIFNRSFMAGPEYYPPIFPLLLAPVYKISALNLIPMKLEQVFFLLLSLAAIYGNWKRDLGSGSTLALVAMLGFAPAFWIAKDNVLSDLLFLFLFYLTVLLVRSRRDDTPAWWCWAVGIGLVIYVAIGTRVVGISLGAGLVLYDVLRLRTVSKSTVVSITVCGTCLALQRYIAGIGLGGYPSEHLALRSIANNIATYTRVTASFWVGSTRNFLAYAVLALFFSLVLKGFFAQCKRGFTFVEAALIPYLTIIVLPPYEGGVRIVFPVVPWIGYLALSGLNSEMEKRVSRHAPSVTWVLILLIAIPFGQFYFKHNFGPIRETTGLPEFNQLCQAVRDKTGPEDPIIYIRARALSLYTGRPASVPNYRGSPEELWQWAENIHAKYLLTTNAFNDDQGFLDRFLANNARRFDLVYENANFRLYRIRSFTAAFDHPRKLATAAPPA